MGEIHFPPFPTKERWRERTHRNHKHEEDDLTMPVSITAERTYREQLLIQRGQFLRLRAELRGLASDDSVRPDAAKLTHLEAAAQLEAIEARLESIDDAIHRFATGEFGACAACGEEIPGERLDARPDALLCVPCCERTRRSA